jgi:hypothetical protein
MSARAIACALHGHWHAHFTRVVATQRRRAGLLHCLGGRDLAVDLWSKTEQK